VHIICPAEIRQDIVEKINEISGVTFTLTSDAGGPTRLEFR